MLDFRHGIFREVCVTSHGQLQLLASIGLDLKYISANQRSLTCFRLQSKIGRLQYPHGLSRELVVQSEHLGRY